MALFMVRDGPFVGNQLKAQLPGPIPTLLTRMPQLPTMALLYMQLSLLARKEKMKYVKTTAIAVFGPLMAHAYAAGETLLRAAGLWETQALSHTTLSASIISTRTMIRSLAATPTMVVVLYLTNPQLQHPNQKVKRVKTIIAVTIPIVVHPAMVCCSGVEVSMPRASLLQCIMTMYTITITTTRLGCTMVNA